MSLADAGATALQLVGLWLSGLVSGYGGGFLVRLSFSLLSRRRRD